MNKQILKAIVTTNKNHQLINTEWGSLKWLASKEIGNSPNMTIGECRIKPGMENPRHHHPNCEEVLVVSRGRISHSIGDDDPVIMEEGNVITIPPMLVHNARNIGNEEAVLSIAFNSADRETIGE